MSIQTRIEDKLRSSLSPTVLEVTNESHMHNVPRGSETHFKVVIVSAEFEGKPLVSRHRLVYDALSEEMRGGVHALAITSKSPAEWEDSPVALKSPPCMGGSKAD